MRIFIWGTFAGNIGIKRIEIKGRNMPSGFSTGVSSPGSVTSIDISESDEPSLVGSKGCSHGLDTSRNVDSSHKKLRIHSEPSRTRGNKSTNTLSVRESRGQVEPKPLLPPGTPNHLPLLPQKLTNFIL